MKLILYDLKYKVEFELRDLMNKFLQFMFGPGGIHAQLLGTQGGPHNYFHMVFIPRFSLSFFLVHTLSAAY